jgi:HAMP domain-containing protein
MSFKNLSISKKVGVIVAVLLVFDVLSYVKVIYNTKQNSDDSQLANVAGRNRFLSQRMTALASASLSDNLKVSRQAKLELKNTITFFKRNLNVLIHGGLVPSLSNKNSDLYIAQATDFTLPALIEMKQFFKREERLLNIVLYQSKNIKTYSYDNTLRKRKVIEFLNPKVLKAEEQLFKKLLADKMLLKAQKIVDAFSEESKRNQSSFFIILLLIASLNFMVIGMVYWMIYKYITKPIRNIQEVAGIISAGDFTRTLHIENNDEIGQVAISINTLIDNMIKASNFAEYIGKNQLDVEYESLGQKDTLGNSLLVMRNNLAEVADKESKRNWINEGLAKFTDIIRDTENVEVFYNNVLSNLIRYINANQGYLYVINDERNEPFMEIKAVYAYGKQRYLEEKQEILYKQGLVGQAWFDKEPLYFTEIPQDFVNITSGMGEATPTCIFIVPLTVNEQVHGVLEIASFEPLESHKIEFVNKLSETIASTVSNVKTNERTKYLLEQSQQQTEEMRAQEEEMHQNMEEMQATQAEMTRKEREMNFMINKMQKQEVEMNENMKQMEEMQLTLQQEQEKNKQKAQNFKKKMEALDEELEGKKAELYKAKKIIEELEQRITSTN